MFNGCQHKKIPNTNYQNKRFNFYLTNIRRSRQKFFLCITRPETILRVLAFVGLGYRLGSQILHALAKVPFLG
jgi:hypothetical protein